MRPILTAMMMWGLLACRPEPGDPDYPDQSTMGDTGGSLIPRGPDPYEEGERRLSVGLFYESGFSDIVEINDKDTHYYIYDSTYTQSADTLDVVEGREAAVLTHGTRGWFGGGLTWDVPRDLSGWDTMYVSMKAVDPSLEDVAIHFTGGGTEGVASLVDYGWQTDGEWHHLEIPLADYTAQGVSLSQVTAPFVMIGVAGADGAELKIDNLYFTGE